MVPFELIKFPYWVIWVENRMQYLTYYQSKSPDSDSCNTQHQTHRLQLRLTVFVTNILMTEAMHHRTLCIVILDGHNIKMLINIM